MRGNSKRKGYAQSRLDARLSTIKADPQVVEDERLALQARAQLAREQIRLLDVRLIQLTQRTVEDLSDEETNANRKRIAQASKLHAVWAGVGEQSRRALGIVTERSLRTEKVKEVEVQEDEFVRMRREYAAEA